ncbi:MAG: primosomal protein N' [Proteobacteria bacterium]|nr:primosomal protein N' [Pseudomonadota bacterium]
MTVVRVTVPLFLPKALDYALEEGAQGVLNRFVEVPVGKKKVHGLVTELPESSPFDKLKTATLLDAPAVSAQTSQFYHWVARYTLSYPGESLRAALPGGYVPEPVVPDTGYLPTGKMPEKMTDTRKKVLDTSAECGEALTQAELARRAGVSPAVVKGLAEQGCLRAVPILDAEPVLSPAQVPTLSAAQKAAADAVAAAMTGRTFTPFLLDGVTGSGKTEVYFDVLAEQLAQSDGQSLILVPEIALTPQWLDRFEKRFGFRPDVWHSSIADGARRKTWWRVLEGKARVVIGARSALFLPFADLRLVVVDEEHDSSYKQEEVFRYHGRDMAIVRARLANCPVVLASATPSLESWNNTAEGRYTLLHLPERHGDAQLPAVRMIDLRQSKTGADAYLSPTLLAAIEDRLAKGEQTLLFLNRRGYAPLLICRGCGHRFNCPSCDASLVVHGARLTCHHCGFTEHTPETCPSCDSPSLHAFGPGTRKVIQEVLQHFPHARAAVADRDSVQSDADMADIVTRMEQGALDILIGTQMIAKGHHFPNLTLVGVIDADMGLAHGDLRAAERTFQLLTQVAGRAGRAEKPGEVLLQTYNPEHPLFAALKTFDRDAFYALELKSRKGGGFPPFGRLTALILSGPREGEVITCGQHLARQFPQADGLRLLGPAPAPIARVRDKYRYRLLVRSSQPAHALVKHWLESTPVPKGVRIDIDVDPQSFY